MSKKILLHLTKNLKILEEFGYLNNFIKEFFL